MRCFTTPHVSPEYSSTNMMMLWQGGVLPLRSKRAVVLVPSRATETLDLRGATPLCQQQEQAVASFTGQS